MKWADTYLSKTANSNKAEVCITLLPIHRLEQIYFFLPLFGDWLVGLREIFSSPAFDRTEFTVRPSFKPITLVGVFSLASVRS
jgi:hypothetical protein